MLIATPLIVGALYTGVELFYFKEDSFLYYFIALFAVSLAIFFAKEEINYWYDKKFPPLLDPPIIAWLNNFFPFYTQLEKDDRAKFEKRLALYLNARSFKLMLKEKKSVPEDFKAIIAAHAIQMTLGMKDFLVGDYDRIIIYNHPFPSPGHQFLHTVEVHHEDGLMLLSLEQLMSSIGQPSKNFNIAYYGYAQALLKLYPPLNEIEFIDPIGFLPYDLEHISNITGFEELDLPSLSLAAFFINNVGFREEWPETHEVIKNALNYEF